MQILLVRRYCGLGYGGAERYFATVAGELVNRGFDVTFVGERCDSLPGVRRLIVKIPFRGSIARNLAFFYMAPLKIKAEKLDKALIYTSARIKDFHLFRTDDPLHKPWLSSRYGKRKSAFVGLLPRHRTILYLEKRVFSVPRGHYLFPSTFVKRQLESFYNFSVPPGRLHVIYPGVNPAEFHPPENDHRKDQAVRNILFVGNKSENKGVKRLIRALNFVSSRPFTCTLAGVKASDLKIPAGLKDRVSVPGYVKNPGVLYRKAHVVVIPSLYETFSNVCLEAMASGTPVVISSRAGAGEIVEHGREGLHLFDPLSPAELAVRILEFLDMDSETWKMMSSAAIAKARQFSLDRHMNELISLFEKVQEAKSP